jgi:hypothetical protein
MTVRESRDVRNTHLVRSVLVDSDLVRFGTVTLSDMPWRVAGGRTPVATYTGKELPKFPQTVWLFGTSPCDCSGTASARDCHDAMLFGAGFLQLAGKWGFLCGDADSRSRNTLK